MSRTLLLLALFAIAASLLGCASTDPYAESSIPWNAQQSWEGAPGIPGLEGR
ncbi:MAG: hypothetical protein H3C50_01605 [Kiritimatiellae bacterium]|nr:hypothetical protein [Kiritimatiellia bacterium]MCO5068393.1 hypothetical protein [Kiritimatiellia bacterium]